MCSVSSGWIEKIRFGSRLRGREGSSTSCWQQSELSRSWSSIQKRPLDPIIICCDGSYGASSKRTCTFLGASFSSLSNALNCSPSIQGRRRGSLPSQYSVVASRNRKGAKPQRYEEERRMMELIISCMSDERLKMTRPVGASSSWMSSNPADVSLPLSLSPQTPIALISQAVFTH